MMTNLESAYDLLSLVGEQVAVLNPRRRHPGATEGGGDIDCAVAGLDPLWPLRLPKGWRLCQCLHYDVGGSWCWVLERDGEFVGVDGLEDPSGIGRLGFPTSLALNGSGLEAPPAAQAAYLTTKRLDKRIDAPREWRRIGELARQDPTGFLDRLNAIFGARWAKSLAMVTLDGEVPDPTFRRKSLRRQWLRRLGRDFGAIRWPTLWVLRVAERLRYPTGLCVLIAGPDGAGKSTLAGSFVDSFQPLFGRIVRLHWRPGVLPSPSAMLGAPQGDSSEPHGRHPHGRMMSFCLLLYQWADFQIGGLLRVLPVRARSGLVLWERGWWDIAVDPERYRLRVPKRLVLTLGRSLLQPDLALVLEGPPEVLAGRKSELDRVELERQSASWRSVLPPGMPRVYLDSAKDLSEVSQAARDAVLRFLEDRTVARLGSGWTRALGSASGSPLVPRAPRLAAVGALSLFHPITLGELTRLHLMKALGSVGSLRMAPRASGPPREVREALAPYVEAGGTITVKRSSHSGRYVAAVLGRDGRARIVAKVATDDAGSRALANEALGLETGRECLPAPLTVPRVLAHEEGLLVLEAVRWRLRLRPWVLPSSVAHALGSMFACTRRETPDHVGGFGHGDFTPWNLLPAGDRWVLVDWESASDQAMPFFDVCHFVFQSHALLRRPSREQLVESLAGRGWVGAAFAAYAAGAGLPITRLDEIFRSYLATIPSTLDMSGSVTSRVLEAQRTLRADLSR